jgi:DNA polymerase
VSEISIEETQSILQSVFGRCSFQVWHPTREDWTAEEPRDRVDKAPAPPADLVAVDHEQSPADRLVAIQEDLGVCERCILCRERQNIVFGVGNPDADLVIIGEAPGEQEDAQGEPFVGASGLKLTAMLENVLGLSRDQVYILNVVKCRPPRNRNPNADELESCLPFLHRQIASIAPKVILLMGTVALKSLFDTPQGITRNRGKWRDYNGIPVMPTFHPAFLLHNKEQRNVRLVWHDLVDLRDRMDELGIDRAPVTSRPANDSPPGS